LSWVLTRFKHGIRNLKRGRTFEAQEIKSKLKITPMTQLKDRENLVYSGNGIFLAIKRMNIATFHNMDEPQKY
jgi:hypothetical protein